MVAEKITKIGRFFPSSGYKTPILSYPVLLGMAVLLFLYIFRINPNGVWSGDSYDYYNCSYTILNGMPLIARTPVYPLIIAGIRALAGSQLTIKILILVQFLVYLAAAFTLRKIGAKYIGNKRVVFWVCAIYLLLPAFNSVSIQIVTESFSISGVIFFIWFLIKDSPAPPSVKNIVSACILMGILIMLKPIFIYLLPCVLLFFILLCLSHKRNAVRSIAAGFIVTAAVVGGLMYYCNQMQSKYGINQLTIISSINNFALARQAVGVHPELTDNANLKEILLKIERENEENIYIELGNIYYIASIEPAAVVQHVDQLLLLSPWKVLKRIFYRLTVDVSSSRIFDITPFSPISYIDGFLIPNMIVYWVIIAIAITMICKRIRHTSRIPLSSILLLMITLGITIVAIIGAMGEWARLIMPGAPAFLLISGKCFNKIRQQLLKKSKAVAVL